MKYIITITNIHTENNRIKTLSLVYFYPLITMHY